VFEDLRLEAERASRCSGEKPFSEIFLRCESIVHILYDEVEDVFRHIAMIIIALFTFGLNSSSKLINANH